MTVGAHESEEMKNNRHRAALLKLFLVLSFAAPCVAALPTQQAVEAASVMATPKLMSAYSCGLYVEHGLLPIAIEQGKSMIKQGRRSASDVRAFLQKYDDVTAKMCSEIEPLFIRHKEQVIDAYARQLPGWTGDVRLFLATPGSEQWASRNAEFLSATAPLIQLFYLLRDVAPDFLQEPIPNMKNQMGRLDERTFRQAIDVSFGATAEEERLILIHLLNDKRFQEVSPKRYKLPELAEAEKTLRQDPSKLKYLMPFNSNASDLVRRHFGDLDVMRQLGIPQILERYRIEMQKVAR
jgi:hypothetical protein